MNKYDKYDKYGAMTAAPATMTINGKMMDADFAARVFLKEIRACGQQHCMDVVDSVWLGLGPRPGVYGAMRLEAVGVVLLVGVLAEVRARHHGAIEADHQGGQRRFGGRPGLERGGAEARRVEIWASFAPERLSWCATGEGLHDGLRGSGLQVGDLSTAPKTSAVVCEVGQLGGLECLQLHLRGRHQAPQPRDHPGGTLISAC